MLEVDLVEELGADAYVYGGLLGDSQNERRFVARWSGRALPQRGDVVELTFSADRVHVFDPETGLRIGD
jgi:multiple sugar transport system ATP-binding protein